MAPQSEFTIEELRAIVEKIDGMFLALIGMGGAMQKETVELYQRVSLKYRAAIPRSKGWEWEE